MTSFAVLPPLNALLAIVLLPIYWRLRAMIQPSDTEHATAVFAVLAAIAALGVIVTGAIPAVFWLLRRGRVTCGPFLVAGLLLGNVPFAVFAFGLVIPFTLLHMYLGTMSGRWLPVSELIASTLGLVAMGSTFGTISAAVFWLLAIRGMRDSDEGFR